MAEIVATAVITVLIEKLISGDFMKLARSEGIDSQLNKWRKSLPRIQAVLADAGQKHIREKAIEMWLHDLQDLAYDIDDVLDDLATETMQRKLNQESHGNTSHSISKVLKIIPTCCTSFTPHSIMYGRHMSSKLDKITTKLHDLIEEKNTLGLDVNVNVKRSNKTSRRLEQTSLVDVSKVVGREGDRDALVGKLLGNEACSQNVDIVSIVGLGGVGKTTIAKVLYNDQKVKDHFELRAWVCVSEEFDIFNISKAIFQAINGKNEDFANLDLLHVALKEKLSQKKFLIVLDDVWNEDYKEWELLQNPFVEGAPGSKVVVTTRKTKVALVMNSFQPYNLEVLSNEKAMSLFAKYALDEQNFDNHPSLKMYAQGIVKKCGGLPLALITLGQVLKTKTDDDEWEELLNSEIWNLQDENEILPALRLSYYDLSPHLKQLFAYCSLFPKDYLFEKKDLILMWMAEGFLSQSKGNKSLESLGREYFEELKSRSFFQHSTNDYAEYEYYTMHDLINDLAVSVAGDFFFKLDEKMDINDKNEDFDIFRHFSFLGQQNEVFRKFRELHRARRLRTLLLVCVGQRWQRFSSLDCGLVELLPQLQCLRVLGLSNYPLIEVPKSIGRLKHLRYLNLSNTDIEWLPEEISDLSNLQSLSVYRCLKLLRLPVSFVKLINLRHLDISETPALKKMPLGIGGLTSLQTLSKVLIDESSGFKISELKCLYDLQGQLSIHGLDKVVKPTQAKDANLQQKKGLDKLLMMWSHVFDDSRNPMIEYVVLESLKPYPKLRKLDIIFYGGMKFPSWVGDPLFNQLTELTLHGCRKCSHLPTLGHLSSLRKLVVRRMNEVKTVGFELVAPTSYYQGIAFPSLEVLKFYEMQSWEIWSTIDVDNDGIAKSFPHLRKIYLQSCPKLAEVSIGLMPSLQHLFIDDCSEAVLRAIVGVSPSVVKFKIRDIKGLTQIQDDIFHHLGAVEHIRIRLCGELRYLWGLGSGAYKFPLSLQKLEVFQCKNLVSLRKKEANVGINMESFRKVIIHYCDALESYNCPNSVEMLDIQGCSSMTSLTFSTLKEFSSSKEILPFHRLTYLRILKCENLKSFPHEHLQSLTSLKELVIGYCPCMDYSFPCGLWPPNLIGLGIGLLNKPMSEWGLQNYPMSLVDLKLNGNNSGVTSFAVEEEVSNTNSSFLLPMSLRSLSIYDFMNLESLSEVLQRLTRLEELRISSCPNLRDLSDTTSYPSSLKVTVIPSKTPS